MTDDMQCDKLQVCVVVNNLDEAMRRYSDLLGIGPFVVYTVDSQEMPGITRDGQPTNYRVRVGMAKIGNGILELLENLRGQTIWKDFYDKHGEGVHHIGLVMKNFPAALSAYNLTLSPDGRELVYTYDTQGERTGITPLLDELTEVLAA